MHRRPGNIRSPQLRSPTIMKCAVKTVDIRMDHGISMHMLFDPGHSFDERILREQFGY